MCSTSKRPAHPQRKVCSRYISRPAGPVRAPRGLREHSVAQSSLGRCVFRTSVPRRVRQVGQPGGRV
eukprot:8906982-Pyramimonas_sp.AAC.1